MAVSGADQRNLLPPGAFLKITVKPVGDYPEKVSYQRVHSDAEIRAHMKKIEEQENGNAPQVF